MVHSGRNLPVLPNFATHQTQSQRDSTPKPRVARNPLPLGHDPNDLQPQRGCVRVGGSIFHYQNSPVRHASVTIHRLSAFGFFHQATRAMAARPRLAGGMSCVSGRDFKTARLSASHCRRGSGSCAFASSFRAWRDAVGLGEGGEKGVQPLDQGAGYEAGGFRLAERLRSVFREHFSIGNCRDLYPQSGGASSEGDISGRVPCVSTQAPSSVGRKICVGLRPPN